MLEIYQWATKMMICQIFLMTMSYSQGICLELISVIIPISIQAPSISILTVL